MTDELLPNQEKVTLMDWDVTFDVLAEIKACVTFKTITIPQVATEEEAIRLARADLLERLKATDYEKGKKVSYSSCEFIDEIDTDGCDDEALDNAKTNFRCEVDIEQILAEPDDETAKEVVRTKTVEDHPGQLRMEL